MQAQCAKAIGKPLLAGCAVSRVCGMQPCDCDHACTRSDLVLAMRWEVVGHQRDACRCAARLRHLLCLCPVFLSCQVRDVTADGGVLKRRLQEGQGEFPVDCPLHDTSVRLHYR